MHTAELDFPTFLPAACQRHVIPALASFLLLSMGQLCDAGCRIAFTATTVVITNHHHINVLPGHPTPATKLWHLDISPTVDAAVIPSPAYKSSCESWKCDASLAG